MLLRFLAFLVPVCAVLWVCRSFFPFSNLVASLPLTWPLAVHPDSADSYHGYDDEQRPLESFLDKRPKAHKHHSVAQPDAIPPVKGEFSRKIVAVGDLHGDLPNAQQVLQMAGVVDKDGNWSGGVDIFVQTGDIIDR